MMMTEIMITSISNKIQFWLTNTIHFTMPSYLFEPRYGVRTSRYTGRAALDFRTSA